MSECTVLAVPLYRNKTVYQHHVQNLFQLKPIQDTHETQSQSYHSEVHYVPLSWQTHTHQVIHSLVVPSHRSRRVVTGWWETESCLCC